eukprot:scaffold82954_cov15-Tisochrysis_lutea.AAC.1
MQPKSGHTAIDALRLLGFFGGMVSGAGRYEASTRSLLVVKGGRGRVVTLLNCSTDKINNRMDKDTEQTNLHLVNCLFQL